MNNEPFEELRNIFSDLANSRTQLISTHIAMRCLDLVDQAQDIYEAECLAHEKTGEALDETLIRGRL